MFKALPSLSGLMIALLSGFPAQSAGDLAARISRASSGTTIDIPPGIHRLGDLRLPPGVGLKGAGYKASTIDARGFANGLIVQGEGAPCTFSDLTIRGAREVAVKIVGAREVTIRRLRLSADVAGLAAEGSRGIAVEDVIVRESLTGISLRRVEGATIANTTIIRPNSIAFNLIDTRDAVVFNNLVVDGGIGVQVGGHNQGLVLDHNMYVAQYVGRIGDQPPRVSIPTWRYASNGLDAHSLQLPVRFADAEHGDFRIVSALDWNPARATTSDWGRPELAGRRAPAEDIDGRPRVGLPDPGAHETGPLAQEPPDGSFTIVGDDGSKSAGLFTPGGPLVRYLFQDLPLPAGTHPFRLPTRTQLLGPIPAGDHELRVVEGRLSWTYRRMVGNGGGDNSTGNSDQAHNWMLAFEPGDDERVLLASGWSERHVNLRSMGLADRKARWNLGGSGDIRGLGLDQAGRVYLLRGTEKAFTLVRVDPKDGSLMPWGPARPVARLESDAAYASLTALGESLYLAAPAGDRVEVLDAATARKTRAFPLPKPTELAADPRLGGLWAISDHSRLLFVSPDGRVRQSFEDVPGPLGLGVQGDRLAVASYDTGKVHVLRIEGTAPGVFKLRPERTVGRGDGPYGPILADRFWFQKGAHTSPSQVSLDLSPSGRLAIREPFSRVVVLAHDGQTVLLHTFSQFGNTPLRTPFEDAPSAPTRFFDASGTVSFLIDAKAGSWSPEAYWGHPTGDPAREAIGFFSRDGRRFGVYRHGWKEPPGATRDGVLIVRFDDFAAVPVGFYAAGRNGGNVVIRDRNGDGRIDRADGDGEALKSDDGRPTHSVIQRWMYVDPSGDIRAATSQDWICKGLDPAMVPIYEFPARPAFAFRDARLPSPYTASVANDVMAQSESTRTPDGGLLASFQFQQGSPQGMGFSNSGGVDLARFWPDGRLRWYRPLNDHAPIQGAKVADRGRFLMTAWGNQVEWLGMDEDGLGLGRVAFPAESRWGGYWVDHPDQHNLFRGNDGKLHVVAGDYVINGLHWLTLDGTEPTRRQVIPVTISPARAAQLAAQPAAPPMLAPRPAPPRVIVRRLAKPLPIDGDPARWREAGISPQIVITPVTAHGDIKGAADLSGLVRMGYHGNDLFVQVIQFDDILTFHQPTASYHQQDTVGIMLNGFMEGFQWNLGRFADVSGDVLVRRRFYFGNLTRLPPPEVAPRVIRRLTDSRDMPERALVESATGRDLSRAGATIYEFRLPIDRRTYDGAEDAIFPVAPGKGFWLGVMLRDNDTPGADVQDYEVWPPSFGTFEPRERGAWAVFE